VSQDEETAVKRGFVFLGFSGLVTFTFDGVSD